MTDNNQPRWKRVLRVLLYGICGALILLFITSVVVRVLASRLEARNLEAWQKIQRQMEKYEENYPPCPTNGSARELEELAESVGVILQRPEYDAEPKTHTVPQDLLSYFTKVVHSPSAVAGEPPEAVMVYYRENSSNFDAIVTHLLNEPPPQWESDVTLLYEAPYPNLTGNITLQRVLLTRALVLDRAGDRPAAAATLWASKILNNSLRNRPELISQFIALAVERLRMATIRKMENPPDDWMSLLVGPDFREPLLDAYQTEAYILTRIHERYYPISGSVNREQVGFLESVVMASIGRPYIQACASESSVIFCDLVTSLSGLEPCEIPTEARYEEMYRAHSWWNVLGKMTFPSLGDAWTRVVLHQLEGELTNKVLTAKEARDRNSGKWAENIDGIEESACPDHAWIYEVSPDGDMIIAFERGMPMDRMNIPLMYTTEPMEEPPAEPEE